MPRFGKSKDKTGSLLFGFGCFFVVLGLTLGTMCSGYILDSCFGVDAPLWVDLLLGVSLGSVLLPLTLVVWVLVNLVGLPVPIFG